MVLRALLGVSQEYTLNTARCGTDKTEKRGKEEGYGNGGDGKEEEEKEEGENENTS